MANASYEGWETAAAVGKADTQPRVSFEHTPQDHAPHCNGRLVGHAKQPWEPVALHALLGGHVPRMHKDGTIQTLHLLRSPAKWWGRSASGNESSRSYLPEGLQLGVVQTVAVHVAADLDPVQSQLLHAAP